MKIPNADCLEHTGSENLGARLWRLLLKRGQFTPEFVVSPDFDPFEFDGIGNCNCGESAIIKNPAGEQQP